MIELLAVILACLVVSVIWLGHQMSRLTDHIATLAVSLTRDFGKEQNDGH